MQTPKLSIVRRRARAPRYILFNAVLYRWLVTPTDINNFFLNLNMNLGNELVIVVAKLTEGRNGAGHGFWIGMGVCDFDIIIYYSEMEENQFYGCGRRRLGSKRIGIRRSSRNYITSVRSIEF